MTKDTKDWGENGVTWKPTPLLHPTTSTFSLWLISSAVNAWLFQKNHSLQPNCAILLLNSVDQFKTRKTASSAGGLFANNNSPATMCGGKPRPSSAFDEKPSPQSFTDRRPGPHGQLTHLRFSVCLFVSQQRFHDFIILNKIMHLSIRRRRRRKKNWTMDTYQ